MPDEPSEPLDDYERRVEALPRLTPEEETTLAVAADAGDETAYKRLIEANLGLVIPVAHRYEGRGVPLEDLVNAGNEGLVRAVRRFDPADGRAFSAVAETLIEDAIADATR